MGSESSAQGQGPRPIETPRQAFHARPPETPPGFSAAASSAQLAPLVGVSPEVQLDIERLRAERDALAAELQIERAERLRAEERLRLFEREKLEQMREGAASREKLASELEEARLRAMRAEARQAALDADLRLSEIAERRRGWAEPDRDASADEIAEPDADAPTMDDEPAPPPEETQQRRFGPAARTGGPPPPSTAGCHAALRRRVASPRRERRRPHPRPEPRATMTMSRTNGPLATPFAPSAPPRSPTPVPLRAGDCE